jgi:hypothetical protein
MVFADSTFGAEPVKSEFGFAETTAYINNVAGLRSGPQQGATLTDFSNYRDVH